MPWNDKKNGGHGVKVFLKTPYQTNAKLQVNIGLYKNNVL